MNVGPNKGRRLHGALARFAAILIEEARDITGLSYTKLDEMLGIADGQAMRYSLFSKGREARAPQAAAIQELENRVARLLGRTAHMVVVENNGKIGPGGFEPTDFVEGVPGGELNLRAYEVEDFQLGYDGGWPTYRSLKADPTSLFCVYRPIYELVDLGLHEEWPEMLQLYSWQWGILWDRGLPWLTREAIGVEADSPVEVFLPDMTAQIKQHRAFLGTLNNTEEGRKLIECIAADILGDEPEWA